MNHLFKSSIIVILLIEMTICFTSCKKKTTPPSVTTTDISGITYTTASVGGHVTDDGNAQVLYRGICWNTSENPTIANNKTSDGNGTGFFSSSLAKLIPNTKYYARAYAINNAGTSYGNQVSFTTNQLVLSILTTTAVSDITESSAIIECRIINNVGGTLTEWGVCWGTSSNPTTSNSKMIETELDWAMRYDSYINGLQPSTKYFVRAYAKNGAGTAYGDEVTFTTNGINTATTVLSLTTTVVTSITSTTAVSGGNITAAGTVIITERGLCYSTHQLPTIGDYLRSNGVGPGDFIINLTWLTPSTTYYIRAYATNGSGVAYGDEVSFTTSPIGSIIFNPYLTYGSVTDIDGNVYKTIQIGSQLWMAENLKTTKYNDGTSIQNVTDFIEWSGLTTGAYCWYDNNVSVYKTFYGALYNWFTINTGKLCPTGWHVPTNAEWITLTSNLGGNEVAGGKLKETGTTHWQTPNIGATNASGFTALPGGTRNLFSDPDFNDWSWITQEGNWWSASPSPYSAIYWGVFYDNNRIDSQSLLFKQSGFSVRCLKDN